MYKYPPNSPSYRQFRNPHLSKSLPHPAPYFPKALSSGDRPKNKKGYENTKEKVNIRTSNNKKEKRRMHHADMSVSNMRARFEKKTTSCPSANTAISSTPHAPANFPLGYHIYLEHQILEIEKK